MRVRLVIRHPDAAVADALIREHGGTVAGRLDRVNATFGSVPFWGAKKLVRRRDVVVELERMVRIGGPPCA